MTGALEMGRPVRRLGIMPTDRGWDEYRNTTPPILMLRGRRRRLERPRTLQDTRLLRCTMHEQLQMRRLKRRQQQRMWHQGACRHRRTREGKEDRDQQQGSSCWGLSSQQRKQRISSNTVQTVGRICLWGSLRRVLLWRPLGSCTPGAP